MLTGYLEYLKAGQLRKVIETPFKETFLVTEDYIEIERDGKTHRLSMSKSQTIMFEPILTNLPSRTANACAWSLMAFAV